MYAIQSGVLMPPDMVVKGLWDPTAYPGTDPNRAGGAGYPYHGMQRARAYQRGFLNPHVLFATDTNVRRDTGYREDPFGIVGMQDGRNALYPFNDFATPNMPPNLEVVHGGAY